ncbi:hypothetical protein RRG08_007758 [Elysia crispata]|uniref:Uncharacterized protein n=1 Tax=Elysia crispata TaxID=231223 RepID=A0AAE1B2A8_9GAST|nr:hypothetical protein RRG08_007758 [Elysia crispata]
MTRRNLYHNHEERLLLFCRGEIWTTMRRDLDHRRGGTWTVMTRRVLDLDDEEGPGSRRGGSWTTLTRDQECDDEEEPGPPG